MKSRLNFRNICLGSVLLLALSLTACSDDEKESIPITLIGVTSLDKMDVPIIEAAMGDLIAVHGTGLDMHNIDSVLINDVAVDMLEIYAENDILYLKIPVELPTKKTDKIYIYNSTGCQEIALIAKAPSLRLERMFNEYTNPGDTIMIYGDYFDLYEINPLHAEVDFNGKISKVITCSNNFLTTQVPEDVDKNIKVKVRGTKFKVEATCPGRYYDREFMIMDFDESKPKSMANVVVNVKDPQRFSGNFLRIDKESEYSSWWYIAERGNIKYTADMLGEESCKKYVVKCEFRTANQFIKDKIKFCNYLFWAAPTCDWAATDFNIQNINRWETITLPFVVIKSTSYPNNYPGSYTSFNMRLEIDANIARNFAFDNIRIYKIGD